MSKSRYLIGYKVIFGLLSLNAVVTEIVVTLNRGIFRPDNFFSYFTIQSNIFAAAMLLVSAYAIWRKRKGRSLPMTRGAATLYMVITGLVFSILLSGLKGAHFTVVPRDNIILHYIMPVAVLLDWLIDAVPKRIAFRRALSWIIYPLIYVVYTLIRGTLVGWYPYPFLDPATHGYAMVAVTTVVIALLSLPVIYLLTRVAKPRSPRSL